MPSSARLGDMQAAARPWTPTPSNYRNELRSRRKVMLEEFLLIPELTKDLQVRLRCKALVDELLWRLAEMDEEGETISSIGEGGDGIGATVGHQAAAPASKPKLALALAAKLSISAAKAKRHGSALGGGR